MTRTVLIMRHGKSRWDDLGVSDHDRRLTARGKSDALRMGEELRALDLIPDAVVTSTARRARGTARRVTRASGAEGKVRLHAGFYFEGLRPFLEVLASLDQTVQCVLLVGHNPTVEELVFHLTGTVVGMPTAALARVDLPVDDWSELNGSTVGELGFLVTPQDLR